jgi:hypothetical protein
MKSSGSEVKFSIRQRAADAATIGTIFQYYAILSTLVIPTSAGLAMHEE